MTNSRFRCPGCKNYFRIADAYSSNGVNRYCSAACMGGRSIDRQPARNAPAKRPSPKPNARSEPTEATSLAVWVRDGGRCVRCGTTSDLHKHHIRYRSEFGRRKVDHSATNLMLLCLRCHDEIHSNKRHWQPVCLAYVWLRYTEGPLRLKEAEARVGQVHPLPTLPSG